VFTPHFWTCPACGAPLQRLRPSEGWWTCPDWCPVNPAVEGQPSYYTGGNPKGAVDDWFPENSPGTKKIPIPGAEREGPVAYLWNKHLIWLVDDRVLVVREEAGVQALVRAREETRKDPKGWETAWDGKPPPILVLQVSG